MKKKSLYLFAALLALGLAPSLASAQNSGGNGGRGGGMVILCYKSLQIRDQVDSSLRALPQRGTINAQAIAVDLHLDNLRAKPVVLDWAESRKLLDREWEIPITRLEGPYHYTDEEVHNEVWRRHYGVWQRTDPDFWRDFDRKRTQPETWLTDPNGPLRVDDASWDLTIPRYCTVVQAAKYDETLDYVHLDKRIAELLDLDQRVALWVHEDLTHFYRKSMEQFASVMRAMGECESMTTVPEYVAPQWPLANTNVARALSAYMLAELPFDSPRYVDLARRVAAAVDVENGVMNIYVKNRYTRFGLASTERKMWYADCSNRLKILRSAQALYW
jgi:hypothetical protein